MFIVAVGWLLVLASWLRSRTETRGVNSISTFSRHLSVLERTSPARHGVDVVDATHAAGVARPTPMTPMLSADTPYRAAPAGRMSLARARRRRRDVLVGLVAATAVFGVLAVVAGTLFVAAFVLAAVALGAYVALLARAQHRRAEREAKVRYLPPPTTVETSTGYWLQQSGS
jgi:hypothetical protein